MSAGLLGTAASGASAPAPHSPTTDGDFAILVRVPSSKLGPAESVMIDLTRLTSRAPGRDGALEKGGDSIPVSEEEDDWTYPDGGWRAWGVVLGCFLYAATTMAFGLTWGVFAESFLVNETFGKNVSPATINTVQGLANFSATSIAFIAGRLGDRYGYKRMIAIGSILSFLSLIASSFSTSLVELFLFQGAALGLSGGLSFPLVISLPSQWFQRRRGLATGIAISGSGIGGAALAAIVRAMLPRVGYRNVYLILAFVHGLLFIVAWFLLEVRERPLRDGEVKVPRDWLPSGVWRDVAFYAISLSVLLSIFGYLTPFYYITSFTRATLPALDPKGITIALPLVAMNISGGVGRIVAGIIADRLGPVNCLFLAFFLGASSQLLMWTFVRSLGSIVAFAIVYGFLGPCFLSLLPVAAAQLFGVRGLATMSGFLILCNSPGQFAGASIAGVVQTARGYQAVALYSGCMMLVGSLCLLPARFVREPRVWARY